MNRGFSLLETILAGFIISLVMMAVFNIFPSSSMAIKRGEMQLLADSIASRHLETWRSKSFDTLSLGPCPAIPDETKYGTTFKTRAEILSAPPSDTDVLKRVQVTVRWSHSNKNYKVVQEAWLTSVEN